MRPFLMVESAVLLVVTHSAINQSYQKILLTLMTRTQDYAHVDKNCVTPCGQLGSASKIAPPFRTMDQNEVYKSQQDV